MLPDEYKPLVLNPRQQQNHDLITSLGFRISPLPFAGKGEVLYFFAMRADVEYTVDLYFGSVHQTGTHKIWQLSELQAAFGSGERLSVSSPCEAPVPVVIEEQKPPVVAPEAARQELPRQEAAKPLEHGGLTPSRSPVKAVKKKQTALF